MAEDNSANFYYLGANSFSSPINECDELEQLYESDEYGAWVESYIIIQIK